ncbi:MAG: NUDIX hydrolase [archaeon]
MERKLPGVGVSVIIKKDSQVLMGKRIGSHAAGTWQFPGGHLEYGESWESCALREIEEETGLQVTNIKFITATNDIFEKDNKHYVTLFLTCDYVSGTPQLKEPERCEGWSWFSWDSLPEPLMSGISTLKKENFKL